MGRAERLSALFSRTWPAAWTTLRFLLGGKYRDLRALARKNFDANEEIQQRQLCHHLCVTANAVAPRAGFLSVQFWRSNESIYKSSGKPDPNYRPDPTGKAQLAALASATGGRTFGEGNLGGAATALRTMLAGGPTRSLGRSHTTHPLAPYVALLALLPLGLVFLRNVR